MCDAYLATLGVTDAEAENRYFQAWLRLHGRSWDGRRGLSYLTRMVDVSRRSPNLYWKRCQMAGKYSWAVPSDAALRCIAEAAGGRRIVDVGAGTGYWAHLLQAAGHEAVAVDNGSEPVKSTWTAVVRMDATEFLVQQGRPSDVAFTCWPRHMSWLEHFGGRTLIWIGEEDGCTDWLHPEEYPGWACVTEATIPQWAGINDLLRVYERRQD